MGAIGTFHLQPSWRTMKDTIGTFLCYRLEIKKKLYTNLAQEPPDRKGRVLYHVKARFFFYKNPLQHSWHIEWLIRIKSKYAAKSGIKNDFGWLGMLS
jgi:hypothetical protein